MIDYTRDEMEALWQVCTNDVTRLTKRLKNELDLDPAIRGVIEDRISVLERTISRLLKELDRK